MKIMVELQRGYGDGYGVVEVSVAGDVKTNPARRAGSNDYHATHSALSILRAKYAK